MTSTLSLVGPAPEKKNETSYSKIIQIILIIISCCLFIASIITGAFNTGDANDYNAVKKKMGILMGLSIPATIFLVISATLYFNKNIDYSTSFSVGIACFSLGIAFSSLAVSTISKKY